MKHKSLFNIFFGALTFFVVALTAFVSFGEIVFAQPSDLQILTRDGETETANSSKARDEIFESVTNEIANEYILNMIGAEKFDQHKRTIEKQILTKKDRFFPIVKGGTPVRTDGKTRITVSVQFSFDDLKSILRAEGLLNPQQGPGTILPMFFVLDEVESQSYKWWYGSSSASTEFANRQLKVSLAAIKKAYNEKGFYMINPVEWNLAELFVPAIRRDSYRKRDYMSVGEYFGAQIILTGMIRFYEDVKEMNRTMIEFRLTAFHTNNGRIVGEAIRKFPTDAGGYQTVVAKKMKDVADEIAGELANQTFSAWQEGALGTKRVRLSLKGELSYDELEAFKKHVNRQFSEIRNIRERVLEDDRSTFELDSDSSPSVLADRLKGTKFSGLILSNPDISSDGVTFDAQRN